MFTYVYPFLHLFTYVYWCLSIYVLVLFLFLEQELNVNFFHQFQLFLDTTTKSSIVTNVIQLENYN